MIKGLIALFTSGIIFNPLVLLGIIVGFVAMARLDAIQIKALFTNYHLYLLVLLVSAVYSFMFKKVYREGGDTSDYLAMTIATFTGVIKFAVAAVLAMSFVEMLSFN